MKAPKFPGLNPPTRVLLGPGPGMPHPRVVRALGAPTLGHLDPELLRIFSEEQELLRYVFQTENEWTFALSGTGTAGMESALANLIGAGRCGSCLRPRLFRGTAGRDGRAIRRQSGSRGAAARRNLQRGGRGGRARQEALQSW